MQQIQLPQGMKDTILNECEKKKYLQNTLEQIFESFGYEEIITPTIEYYETYENAFKNIQTTDMYKFFDENGRILTLRTDMTVPIARVCASKFKDSKPLAIAILQMYLKYVKNLQAKEAKLQIVALN